MQGNMQSVLLRIVVAGAPAVVANLWDVTDRDIDRFSRSLLCHWVPSHPEHSPLPDRQAAESPKTEEVSLSAAVSASRPACRLKHLIGAAPVCYGLPCLVQGHRAPSAG